MSLQESMKRDRARRVREDYASVKQFSPRIYEQVIAFASVVDLTSDGARARVEEFCMRLVADVHRIGS